MKNFKTLITLCLASIGLLASTSTAIAEDFPHRKNLDSISRQQALGDSEINLLESQQGPGKAQVSQAILEKLGTSNVAITTKNIEKIDENAKRIRTDGDGWTLHVYADGTNVKYWNHKYLESTKNPKVAINERLSNDELEALGREFIDSKLTEYIKLGPNEKLVPFATKHQIRSGQSTAGGPINRQVISSAVVFSRTVNDIDIIGPGSKVAIIFANDGTPVAFEFDWTAYTQSTKSQKLLNLNQVQERASATATMKRDVDHVELQRFECGYYDMGVRHRDVSAPIQPACSSHYVVRKNVSDAEAGSGDLMMAIADATPIGESVELDKGWPQTLQLNNEGDSCTPSPLNEAMSQPDTEE